MTTYTTNIHMSQDTVDRLTDGHYSLYAFKAVKSTAQGSPLIWFATKTYSLLTNVEWEEQYNAYTSRTEIRPNTRIVASASYAIDLDQTLNVNSTAGTGSVDTQSGVPGAISINNTTNAPFTCGISQTDPNGNVSSMCAFNLYGLNLDVIAPIEQVLFMFATAQINTGTVIEKAFTSGLIVDLTGAPQNTREVKYEINNGWSWSGEPWGKQVAPNASLVPLLIQNSPALATMQIDALHAA